MSITAEAKKEVERLLRGGQKIQAIKYLRDTFDIALPESKLLVEALEKELASPSINSPAENAGTALSGDLKAEVTRLLQAGKKIEAVKYVKTDLRTGLKEALAFVEEVEREINPDAVPANMKLGGCFGGGFRIVGWVFGSIGLLFMLVAGIIYYLQLKTIEKSDQVTGIVVDFQSSGSGSSPVIAYEWQGQKRQYHSSTSSNPPAYEMNEEVPMYVNHDNPADVIVDTFTDRWLLMAIFGGLGSFFTLFSAIFMFASRKF